VEVLSKDAPDLLRLVVNKMEHIFRFCSQFRPNIVPFLQ